MEKQYRQALELARQYYGPGQNEFLDTIFPELKESEDERIREELIGHCKDLVRMNQDDKVMLSIYEPWLAWLEKQKEQKLEVKYVYPKFRKGDIIEPIKPNGSYTPVRVRSIHDASYICRSDDGTAFLSLPLRMEDEYRLVEQTPAEWSNYDEKMKDAEALELKKIR